MLLLHDGELADVRAVLDQVGTVSWETLEGATPASWDLGFATPRHLHRLASVRGWTPHGARVAVAERDSRTLQVLVDHCEVDRVVRRPVHPTALRLLIHHAVHPDRVRSHPRVAVGVSIDVYVDLHYLRGVLADLSLDGCRLLTEEPLPRGKRLMIAAPGLEEGRPWFLYGQVVREVQEPDHLGTSVGVRFRWPVPENRKRLEALFQVYRRGPATLAATLPSIAAPAAQSRDPAEEILLTEVVQDDDPTLRLH